MPNPENSNHFLLHTAIAVFIALLVPITFLLTDKILHEALQYQLEVEPAHTRRSNVS